MLIGKRDDQGPHKGVPSGDEGQDRHSDNGVDIHGNDHLDEELQIAAAVHLCGLEQGGRRLHEIFLQHKDVKAVGNCRQHNTGETVQKPQAAAGHVVLDDQDLRGDHHGQHEQVEAEVTAGKGVDAEGVGTQNGERQGYHHAENADPDGVAEKHSEGDQIPGVFVVLPLGSLGHPLGRDGDGLRQCFQGGEEHPDKGEHHHQCADDQHHVFDDGENRLAGIPDLELCIFSLHRVPSLTRSGQISWRPPAVPP